VCIPISPDSPIIDTPSKYNKMVTKRAAASLLNNSQATQPTPSAPPGGAKHNTPGSSLSSASSSKNDKGSSNSGGSSSRSTGSKKNANANADDANDNASFALPSSPPIPHSPYRVPETPLDIGVDIPASPPLPLLTAENFLLLDSQPTCAAPAAESSSHANAPSASPAPATAPSVRSLPSEISHRISRLVLRTNINAAKHEDSEEKLAATRKALSLALTDVQHEASRVDSWKATVVALLLLCLAYASWCRYNSAEFAFIEECRRKWFGL
jgi:hypothetical protein